MGFKEYEAKEVELLKNIKRDLPDLQKLLEDVNSEWEYEDTIYRFYHQSFKTYRIQDTTLGIVQSLRELLPNTEMHPWFKKIVEEGTSEEFDLSHNENWLTHTRSIIEAFLHAKFMLEMVVKYGKELNKPESMLPSGWAAVLTLYGLR